MQFINLNNINYIKHYILYFIIIMNNWINLIIQILIDI